MRDTKRVHLKIRLKTGRPAVGRAVMATASETGRVFGEDLFQSVYDGILLTDAEGRIRDANPRASVLLRRPAEELRSMRAENVIAGVDKATIGRLLPDLTQGRFALIEAYGLRPNRASFPAEVAVSLLRPDPPTLCFFIRDITRRREAEDLMRTGYNALQHASNGIAVLGLDRRLRYANRSLCRLWGGDGGVAVLHRAFEELIDDPAPARAMLNATLERHEEWRGEMTGRRLDGTTFPVLVAAAGNRDTDGEWTGAVVSITDITDARRAEEAVREAERKQVMLASLAAACHHLAQPATVILGNLGILSLLTEQTPEELRMLIASSAEAAEELARVLHRLNAVEQYRTVNYLEDSSEEFRPDNQVLEI